MINSDLSHVLQIMSEYLDLDEAFFEARAYSKVARVLESMEEPVDGLYKQGGIKAIQDIEGVGKGIAEKIEEYIKTGDIKRYHQLKKKCPVKLEELTQVEGLGPRKIKILYQKLGVKNLKDLEKAAKAGQIAKLDNFGDKSEKNILQAIGFVKAGRGRFLLGQALPVVRDIISDLDKRKEVGRISLAGSMRRMKETVGDADILVTSRKPAKVMEYFVRQKDVVKIWAQGETKSSIRLKSGLDCDLRVVDPKSFGAALQYFTGSKDHNILTRRLAIKKGLKLNEYGVFSARGGGKKQIAGKNEEEVYQAIGLPFIEPEMREAAGELELALDGKLPKLVGYSDIEGETQCHTLWSDGVYSIEQMAKAAKKLGYKYIVITDHAGFMTITNALNEERLLKYMAEIDKIDKKVPGIKILKGAEVDIKLDGTMAIKDEVLAKLDIVLASIHSSFKMIKADMTKRIIRAIENPHVDIIAHPTGRKINKREPFDFDRDLVFKAAKTNKTAMEINAHYERLDLKDIDIKKAIELGVKLTMGTDAHTLDGLQQMEYGIAQARRGWAEKKHILNAQPLNKFLGYFKPLT